MSLSSGTPLGPYEIVGQLGSGGMGREGRWQAGEEEASSFRPG